MASNSEIAERVAREIFEKRGNYTEVDITEDGLAFIIESAFALRDMLAADSPKEQA